jgi:hypothetical protein
MVRRRRPPYDQPVLADSTVDVRLTWPARSLPGVCARTGRPTRDGVVVTPRGAGYVGAEVIVPFSRAAQARRRALWRLAGFAAVLAVGFGASCVAAWFLVLPAAMCAVVAGYAARSAYSAGVSARVDGRELVISGAHPGFAQAVAAMPAGCGGGGCDSCLSGCLPQAAVA